MTNRVYEKLKHGCGTTLYPVRVVLVSHVQKQLLVSPIFFPFVGLIELFSFVQLIVFIFLVKSSIRF